MFSYKSGVMDLMRQQIRDKAPILDLEITRGFCRFKTGRPLTIVTAIKWSNKFGHEAYAQYLTQTFG